GLLAALATASTWSRAMSPSTTSSSTTAAIIAASAGERERRLVGDAGEEPQLPLRELVLGARCGSHDAAEPPAGQPERRDRERDGRRLASLDLPDLLRSEHERLGCLEQGAQGLAREADVVGRSDAEPGAHPDAAGILILEEDVRT